LRGSLHDCSSWVWSLEGFMEEKPMRIAVVGLGVLGASAARALARGGVRVTVFERTAPGAGTSGTSYGWINSHRKNPRGYHDLNVAGMAEHERLRENGCDWYVRSGLLEWATDDASRERLNANVGQLGEYGYPVERITRAHAAELASDVLIPSDVTDLVWYPSEGYALPVALLARLWGEARDLGAELRCPAEVVAVEPVDGGVRVHRANAEPERFDRVVLAVGRWTQQLTEAIEPTVPMVGPEDPASPGLLAYTAPLPARIPFPVITPTLNFRPDGAGRLLLHALDLNQRLKAEEQFVDEVLNRLRAVVRGAEHARIDRVNLGLRSLPADGHTVAGPDTSGYIYILATHSGVTLGPLLGRLAAREILGGEPAPELAAFRPARFTDLTALAPLTPARNAGEQ
jgi:glycine/D-amino acid oxidase-like deaminating enzyme